MNRTERLTAILLLLQERQHTAGEIARHFEVSRRTILRDIQALAEMGLPVMAKDGAGGGYSLPPGYTLAPLALTHQEALLLLLSLEAINKLSDIPFAQERVSLIAKLRALLPDRRLQQVEEMLQRISLAVPQRPQRAPFVELLLQCAQQGQWVQAAYRSEKGLSKPLLLPLRLYAQSGYWYCVAYAYEARQERNYRIDRFEQVELVSRPPEDVKPAPSLPYDHPSHPQILVKLTPSGVLAVERDPHIGNEIRRNEDGSGELTFRCPPSELDWYARYFASLSDSAEVCSPEELRHKIHQIGQKIVQRYSER